MINKNRNYKKPNVIFIMFLCHRLAVEMIATFMAEDRKSIERPAAAQEVKEVIESYRPMLNDRPRLPGPTPDVNPLGPNNDADSSGTIEI